MNQAETYAFLYDMFAHVDAATAELFDLAMTRARVVDGLGRPPISPLWSPTFDEWIAAAEVADLLHVHGAISPSDTLKQFTSEGATFVFNDTAATNWLSVAAHLRSRSTLAANTGWAMAEIPSGSPDFTPRSEEWL